MYLSVSSLWRHKVNYASNPSFFSLPRTADVLRFKVMAISLTGTDFLYRSMRQSSCSFVHGAPCICVCIFSVVRIASRLSMIKCCAAARHFCKRQPDRIRCCSFVLPRKCRFLRQFSLAFRALFIWCESPFHHSYFRELCENS